MKTHKYDSLLKFVHLDGVKEFKETNPSLFSEDGISTSTMCVENDMVVSVTIEDAKNACEKFLNGEISLRQLQQWGEWIHMMDFFELIPDGEAPENDETLIDIITDIDMLDMTDDSKSIEKVKEILQTANKWLNKN